MSTFRPKPFFTVYPLTLVHAFTGAPLPSRSSAIVSHPRSQHQCSDVLAPPNKRMMNQLPKLCTQLTHRATLLSIIHLTTLGSPLRSTPEYLRYSHDAVTNPTPPHARSLRHSQNGETQYYTTGTTLHTHLSGL